MPEPTLTDLAWRLHEQDRRIERIEREWDEYEPEIISYAVRELAREFRQWKFLLCGGVLSIIAAVVISALT